MGRLLAIERFSHFVKTRVAARFRRVESLFPSFELLRRDIVMLIQLTKTLAPIKETITMVQSAQMRMLPLFPC